MWRRRSIRCAGDLVHEGVHAVDDLISLGLSHAHVEQRIDEMRGEEGEVMLRDAATMVCMRKRPAGVGNGAAGGHREEIALHVVQLLDGRMPEKRGQLGIGKHFDVKGGDEVRDHVLSAEAFI